MWENITSSTKGDATWEIIIMLLGAFILGYLLRYLLGSNKTTVADDSELLRLRKDNTRLQADLDACRKKKSSTSAGFVAGAAAAAATVVPKREKPANPDDLKKVEGIGPKIESILNAGGIWTWSHLAESNVEPLRALLKAEWPNNKVHDPRTWPEQAALARDGKWDELKTWQDELKGGK